MTTSTRRLRDLARSVIAPERGCVSELRREPVPLVSDELDVALLWNAKAACTFAVKWLFWQEGVLDEALAYSSWPHDYREQVFCRRPTHDAALRRVPTLGPRAVKFVRNPFDRAVGGYLFFANWARRAEDRKHLDVLEPLSAHLGRDVLKGERFSFREFVAFLETIDLDTADVHLRRQLSGCERAGALPGLSIVRVEESVQALSELERDLGLRRSDPARLARSNHHSIRIDSEAFVGDERFARTMGVEMPRSPAFYDDDLEAAVGRLYAGDLSAYGYELDGPLPR